MLKIREFVKGVDEEVWLRIRNEAFKEYDDFRPASMEDMKRWEDDPGFDSVGMFIAEWSGEPVGRVQAFVDKERKERKGFVQNLGVISTYRRRRIGRKLAEKALESLRERNMVTAQCWIRDNKPVAKHLFESLGFKTVRIFSTMRRDLKLIPSNVGENRDVSLRSLKRSDEDIKLVRQLNNEAFSEHFNFRPSTVEEWRHWFTDPDFEAEGWFISYLEGSPVGHVGTWIDRKFVKYKGVKRGVIATIGVLKQFRRKGIGTTLIQRGMEHLKSRGMIEVELGVDDLNQTEAIKLYEKVGFKVIRKELTYERQIA